jgi:multidrug efflux pump subunit AcrA (membrane-fusion protein)
MTRRKIYPILAVVGIAVAAGGAWWYQSKLTTAKEITSVSGQSGAANPASAASAPGGAASAPRAAGVEVAKVEKSSLQDDAQSVGSLRSVQSVMLRPEVPGRVKALGFVDGAQVRKGQLLVQLDDTLQRAEVKQSLAQVSIVKANLKRNQELVAQNFVAQRVVDESSASLQVADAQLALSCARLSRMAILAPFDGTVGIRNINLGDFVKDGADLVNLEDNSSMYVDFRLPERFQGKLKLQQSVELVLDAFPGRAFKARIQALDPLLDANGRSVGVRAVLPNTAGEAAALGPRPGAPGAPGATGATGSPGGPAAAGAAGSAGKPANAAKPGVAAAGGQARGKPASSTSTTSAPVAAPAPAQATASPSAPALCPPDMLTPAVQAAAPVAPAAGKPAAPAPLRAGMFARVNTVFSINDNALLVPEEAIVPQGGRQFVVLVAEPSAVPAAINLPPDTKFVSLRQEVKLGTRLNGKVEIKEGLTEGQTVVVAGQQRLQRDGTPLRIVELGRPPQGAASAPAGGASGPAAPASAASR